MMGELPDPNSKQGRKRAGQAKIKLALEKIEEVGYELSQVGTKNGSRNQRLLRSVHLYLNLAADTLKEMK